MSDYALRQLIREMEWHARVALATADDLRELAETQPAEGAPAVVESLVVRIQKVIELLWPGRYRLADRLYASASEEARRRVGVDECSRLTHAGAEPLYRLLDEGVDGVVCGSGSPVDMRVRGAGREVELRPILEEVREVWNRSAAVVTSEE